MRSFLLFSLLCSASAVAGPAPSEMTDRQKALYTLAKIEAHSASALHSAVKAAIDAKDYEVGDACKTAHLASVAKVDEGKAKAAAQEWKAAYASYRAAARGLSPACVTEFADKKGPQKLRDTVREVMQKSDGAVVAVHDYIKGTASPKSNTYYEKAVQLRKEAKAKNQAGDRKAAVRTWFAAMHELGQAVENAVVD